MKFSNCVKVNLTTIPQSVSFYQGHALLLLFREINPTFNDIPDQFDLVAIAKIWFDGMCHKLVIVDESHSGGWTLIMERLWYC